MPSSTSASTRFEFEARPADWEIAPGHRVAGYAFNGQVPGPTIHAHANETRQMERGLYGALIVHDENEPQLDTERVLVLDDLTLNKGGQIARFGGFEQRHDGRQGDALLINGRTGTVLDMAAGHVERWRVVNAASARYVRLSIGGAQFQVIGSDGGLLPAAQDATEVLLTPGERADLAVGPFAEGESLAIESLAYVRGAGWPGKEDAARFGTVRVGPAAPSCARIPFPLRLIEPLVKGPVAPNRTVVLSSKLNKRRGVDFTIEGERNHMADPVKVGELQVWDIVNETHMEHPFHLHGFFFQVLSDGGSEPESLAWKDTVNIRGESTVRIAWMPDDRPGRWMYHCHILEHHAAGMMATFDVVR
jgi:FtsP/CotA-like multicopper oxidase with cupredoxin domain